jgi:hypothetical protein
MSKSRFSRVPAWVTDDLSGRSSAEVVRARKPRRVAIPTEGEREVFRRILEKGVVRMLVGDSIAAENSKVRLRALLDGVGAQRAVVVAVRDNSIICWAPELWEEARRLNVKIEEAAYREENTITCSVWSTKGYEKNQEKIAQLAGAPIPVNEDELKSLVKERMAAIRKERGID